MQTDSIEALGLVAGAVGAFAYLPQAVKIFRDRSAHDVSALTYSMVLSGNLLWIGYGVMRASPAIVLWNAVAAAIALTVLALKLMPAGASAGRRDRAARSPGSDNPRDPLARSG